MTIKIKSVTSDRYLKVDGVAISLPHILNTENPGGEEHILTFHRITSGRLIGRSLPVVVFRQGKGGIINNLYLGPAHEQQYYSHRGAEFEAW